MYIRIEFEDIESANTKETQELFFSSPNGTFLCSTNGYMMTSKEIVKKVGYSVVFWHLDVEVLNKHYGGVEECLNALLRYEGVSRVDILPIEEDGDCSLEKYDNLMNVFMTTYLHFP